MARTVRSATFDTRNARVKLKQRKAPYWMPISPGFALGYRKAPKGGVWLGKLVKPGVLRKETSLGPADSMPTASMSLTSARLKRRRGSGSNGSRLRSMRRLARRLFATVWTVTRRI